MKRILFDTNIILDIVLKRRPHFDNAERIFSFIDLGLISGFITATTITDIYYISRRGLGHEAILEFISDLIQMMGVLGVDGDVVRGALNIKINDFEDAIQTVAPQKSSRRPGGVTPLQQTIQKTPSDPRCS